MEMVYTRVTAVGMVRSVGDLGGRVAAYMTNSGRILRHLTNSRHIAYKKSWSISNQFLDVNCNKVPFVGQSNMFCWIFGSEKA